MEKIIAVIIGFSWALCAYFVLPILVLENVGPITALKRSAQKFKRNWRKVISINVIFFLFFLALAAIFYGLTFILGAIPMPPLKVMVIIGVIAYILLMTFSVTLGAIANCAVYLYIMKNFKTPYFDSNLLSNVIQPRKKKIGN